MTHTKVKSPPAVTGRASLVDIEAVKLDGLENSSKVNQVQDRPPPEFDPISMPILARHWFGLTVEEAAA